MSKIAFFAFYFGKKPPYLEVFLQSALQNTEFDFIFFNEWGELPVKGDNIIDVQISLADFNSRARDRGLINNDIKHGYKICDLLPAVFDLFEEYFPEDKYEYVGYIDIDMLLGRLDNFLSLGELRKYDIWTIYDDFVAGPLTLFRNTAGIKSLYREANSWKYCFDYPETCAFNENFFPPYKQMIVDGARMESFTEVVRRAERENRIKVCWNKYLSVEWRPRFLRFKKGCLSDEHDREFLCFHYFYSKSCLLWKLPDWKQLPEEFYINKYGFYSSQRRPLNIKRKFLNKGHIKDFANKLLRDQRVIANLKPSKWSRLPMLIKNQL